MMYKTSLSQEKPRGSVLKVDVTSDPLVAGISLFSMLQSGPQQLEVMFAPDASKVALQALSIMRINLANNGRDVLLLLSTVRAAAPARPASRLCAHGVSHVPSAPANPGLGLGGSGSRPHPVTRPPPLTRRLVPPCQVDYAADASGPQTYFLAKLTPVTPPLPCFMHQLEPGKNPAFMAGQGAEAAGGRGVGGLSGMGAAGLPGAKLPAGEMPGLPYGAGVGGVPGGMGMPRAAMGMAAGAAGGGVSAKQRSARKADYVIVTEDTAIKNAAGAIAKVLGRVASAGLCCPVYTGALRAATPRRRRGVGQPAAVLGINDLAAAEQRSLGLPQQATQPEGL
jgi:hypothetical protein